MLHFIMVYTVCKGEKLSSREFNIFLKNYNLIPLDMYNGLSPFYCIKHAYLIHASQFALKIPSPPFFCMNASRGVYESACSLVTKNQTLMKFGLLGSYTGYAAIANDQFNSNCVSDRLKQRSFIGHLMLSNVCSTCPQMTRQHLPKKCLFELIIKV